MYEGNGRWSIPLFGANAENGATDFRGSTRRKPELEKGWLCSGLRQFLAERIGAGQIWRNASADCPQNVHRKCRKAGARGQGLVVSGQVVSGQ
jgi:hypothetical protein